MTLINLSEHKKVSNVICDNKNMTKEQEKK